MKTLRALAAAAAMFGAAAAHAEIVGNAMLSREVVVRDGRLRTVAFRNGVTDARIEVKDALEFRIQVDGQLLTSDDFAVERIDASRVELRNAELHARIDYQATDGAPYLRKNVTIANASQRPRTLRWIEVESLAIPSERLEFSADPRFAKLIELGQPILLDSLWLGLEHPAAHAAWSNGRITMRHYPGVVLAPGESFTSFTAVIGACERGDVRRAFDAYLDSIRYAPGPPKAFFYFNAFRVIKPPDRLGQGLRTIALIDEMHAKYGRVFDAFSYDAGFDTYRPDALWVTSENDLWPKTAAALKGSGMELGFWISFSGIFDASTYAWGRRQGFGLQHPAAYCLAEPNYAHAAKARVLEIVRDDDMKWLSIDGMYPGQGYGCNVAGHGHLVGTGFEAGRYGTERVAVAELEILRAVREVRPDIVIGFFVCGEWASPWWLTVLDGLHSVEHDTIGTAIPSPDLRDELITARDEQLYDMHVRHRRPFPQWAEDLYGFQVRRDHLIDRVSAVNVDFTRKWENELVMASAGRGTITVFPAVADLFLLRETKSGLAFLAGVAQWVRENQQMFASTRYILGDPAKGEVTGYAHGNGARTIIALRNPSIDTREVSITIDESAGLSKSERTFRANVIYPARSEAGDATFGGKVKVTLHGFEVMLLDVRRDDLPLISFPRAAPDRSTPPAIKSRYSTWRGNGRLTATIETRQAMLFMVHARTARPIAEAPRVEVNDREVEAVARSREGFGRVDTWYEVPLSGGMNEIRFDMPRGVEGTVASWVRAEVIDAPPVEVVSNEKLMPVLAPGMRERYWLVQAAMDLPKPRSFGLIAIAVLLVVVLIALRIRRLHLSR